MSSINICTHIYPYVESLYIYTLDVEYLDGTNLLSRVFQLMLNYSY